jgi:hypothetical protein
VKKLFSLIAALIITTISLAQLENANWCFRNYAKVNFGGVTPTVGLSSCGSGNIFSGSSASVSNNAGQLLFYTDGVRVYDKNNVLMPNGNNIGGYSYYGGGAFQGTVIVQKPNSSRYYYIFTVNQRHTAVFNNGNSGFYYSVVDMCANGGNGDIVSGMNKIALRNQNGEPIDFNYITNTGLKITEHRVTTTSNNDGTKIWLSFFTQIETNNGYKRYAYQYLISENGINNTPDGFSPYPNTHLLLNDANFPGTVPGNSAVWGNIKFSPNSMYLCDANTSAVTLYNFNNQTGVLGFNRNVYFTTLPSLADHAGMGVEFSPNSQLLYFSTIDDNIYQENRTLIPSAKRFIRIRQSKFLEKKGSNEIVGKFEVPNTDIIETNNAILPIPAIMPYGNLQLALNNKIYICTYPFQDKLGVILNPNVVGIGCGYTPYDLTLASGSSHFGNLPQWVHKTVFSPSTPCTTPISFWPKAYGSIEESLTLIKDHYGNLMLGATIISFAPNSYYNHIGVFPSSSSITGVPYNSNGSTNWISENLSPGFAFNSGTVQMGDNITNSSVFVDGNTGNIVPTPINLAAGEYMFAETNTNKYITQTIDYTSGQTLYTLNVRSGNITNSTYLGSNYTLGKFNPNTNNILTKTFPNSLTVYHFDGTSFNYVSSTAFPLSAPYDHFANISLVYNQDRVYSIQNGILKCYDYLTGNITNVTISGFNNNNLRYFENVDNYTGNRCLVYNIVDNYIYCLDVNTLTVRKIYSPGLGYHLKAIFNNDDVYLTGKYFNQFNIGTQIIPNLPTYTLVKIFITKLNLQTDFSLRVPITTTKNFYSLKSSLPQENTVSLTYAETSKRLDESINKLNFDANIANNTNVSSILLYNQVGQLIKIVNTTQGINDLMNNKVPVANFVAGIYFLKITYKNNTTETIKRFLN